MAGLLGFFLARLEPMADEAPWALLPMLPYLDWLLGTTVLGDPGQQLPPWTDRVEIARRMLEQSERSLGRQDLSTLTVESTLAFWLIRKNEPAEAEAILERNRRDWRAILDGNQRWHGWLEGLHAAATIRRVLADSGAAPDTDATAALEAGARTIERILPTCPQGPADTPFQRTLRETLDLLAEPRAAGRTRAASTTGGRP